MMCDQTNINATADKLEQIKDALDRIPPMPKDHEWELVWELTIPKSQLPLIQEMREVE